jgi:hypothetical protein
MSKLILNPEHDLYEKATSIFPKEIQGQLEDLEVNALKVLDAVLSPFDDISHGPMPIRPGSKYTYQYYSRYGERLNPLVIIECDTFGDLAEREAMEAKE